VPRVEVPIVPRVEVPANKEVPVNGLTEGDVIESVGTTGTAAINAALIPKLLISRDPSGIPTLVDDPMTVGDMASVPEDDMIEADDVLEAIELQLLNTVVGVGSADEVPPMDMVPDEVPPVDVVPFRPPTPKLEKVEVSAVIPGLDVPKPEHPMLPRELDVIGVLDAMGRLKPPGLSWRAPKGIPVGPTVASGDVPKAPAVASEDVIPIAGVVVVLTCARLGPLGISVAIVMAINNRVVVSLYSFFIGVHRSFDCLEGAPGHTLDDCLVITVRIPPAPLR
jgi:hypothetical protein